MAVIDLIILLILLVSSLISLKRGFTKEALSLASWVTALVVARLFGAQLSALLSDLIASPAWRYAAAFVLLFMATLIVGALIIRLLGEFVRMTGLSGTDRALGMVFGLMRGLVVVVAVLALGRLFAFDQFWQDSILVPYLEPVIQWTGNSINKASNAILSIGAGE